MGAQKKDMNNKWTLLIVTIIMTSLICVSCKQQQVIPKQLDIEVVDGDEISFNIGIDDFVTQFNYLYDDEFLTAPNDKNSYSFSEDDSMLTLPKLSITTAKNGYINGVSLMFDWHSFTGDLLEKYKELCFFSFKTFLPEKSDAEIKKLVSTIIDAGYDNPVDANNDAPYALYYSKNVGIQTRFAIGHSQIIRIVPVNESLIDEYESRGVKIIRKKIINNGIIKY